MDRVSNQEGVLRFLELPFVVRRTYFIQKVPHGSQRGFHAHRSLRQIFLATQGSFELELSTPFTSKTFFINSSNERCLLVPPGYWRILSNFTSDATCMVLASERYDETDYIRNFDDYVDWFKGRFKSED